MRNNENIMKVINETKDAWQLENGLWYEKDPQLWGGVCPKCGMAGGMCYHVWRKEYFVCEDCMVSWHIGDNLFSGWRYMTEENFIANLEFLSETEDIMDVYRYLPLTEETSKMLDELRKKEGYSLPNCGKNDNLIEGETNEDN